MKPNLRKSSLLIHVNVKSFFNTSGTKITDFITNINTFVESSVPYSYAGMS